MAELKSKFERFKEELELDVFVILVVGATWAVLGLIALWLLSLLA